MFCQADRYVAFVDGAALHWVWNTDDVKIVGIVEVSGFKALGIVQDADCRTQPYPGDNLRPRIIMAAMLQGPANSCL